MFILFQPFFDIVVKTALLVWSYNLRIFFKKITIRIFFQSWVKTWDFRLKLCTTIREHLSISSKETLREKVLIETLLSEGFQPDFELFVRTSVEMFSELLWKLHFTFPEESLDSFFFSQNLQFFLQVWANFYRSFERKVSPLSSKQPSTYSEEQLGKKVFFTLF